MENPLTPNQTIELKIGDILTYTNVFHHGKTLSSSWLIVEFKSSYICMCCLASEVDGNQIGTHDLFSHEHLTLELSAGPKNVQRRVSFWSKQDLR